MPSIRFRTPKPPDMDADEAPVLEARSLVSQRIAAELDAILSGYQASGLLPQGLRQLVKGQSTFWRSLIAASCVRLRFSKCRTAKAGLFPAVCVVSGRSSNM